jgi:flagellar export protein FliJ
MNAFRFPLQKVLEYHRKQLELAEVRYKQQLAVVSDLDRQRSDIEAAGTTAEIEVRQWGGIAGCDLAALGRFRTRVKSEEARIGGQRAEAEKEVAVRQEAMLQARRSAKLLERLRERRLEEWEAQRDRELDELASDSFLAQWNRREDPSRS